MLNLAVIIVILVFGIQTYWKQLHIFFICKQQAFHLDLSEICVWFLGFQTFISFKCGKLYKDIVSHHLESDIASFYLQPKLRIKYK
jgi:hypothetical protein